MNDKEIRWMQRFEKYTEHELKNELERAGVIQFFEISFELSWKVMKDYLEAEGLIVKSPRETIKTAVQIELIDNGQDWLDGLMMRNSTVHLYDEEAAEKAITEILSTYIPIMKQLHDKLQKEVK